MKVKLLAYTKDAIEVVYTACKTCYSKYSPINIYNGINNSEENKMLMSNLIEQVAKSGHLSTFEHVNFTFAIENISRACSHQLVRHRHASFSQQSQRYVKFDKPIFYEPYSILKNREADAIYNKFLNEAKEVYKKLVELDIKPEDARYVLPNATCSNISFTMNLRELMHICGLRLCTRAQKEIREVVQAMVDEVSIVQPWLKPYLVAQCEREGFCKEHKSCGRKPKLNERLKNGK